MKKGFLRHMLTGRELALNLLYLALIALSLYWHTQDYYRDGFYDWAALAFFVLLAINWLMSYLQFKPKP